jgi:hypothetical protein
LKEIFTSTTIFYNGANATNALHGSSASSVCNATLPSQFKKGIDHPTLNEFIHRSQEITTKSRETLTFFIWMIHSTWRALCLCNGVCDGISQGCVQQTSLTQVIGAAFHTSTRKGSRRRTLKCQDVCVLLGVIDVELW